MFAKLQEAALVGPAGSASKDCILFHEAQNQGQWQTISPLRVVFPDVDVVPGANVTPAQAKHAPKVDWPEVHGPEGQLYTLIMTDPDLPKDPLHLKGEFVHWVVANCSKSSADGDKIAGYFGPAPPFERPEHAHRYSYFLVPQKKHIEVGKDIAAVWLYQRGYFHVNDYVRKHVEFIDPVPVAASFHRSAYDGSLVTVLTTAVTFSWM